MSASTRSGGRGPPPAASEVLTFLIADVRGYTSFTHERGDEAAALLVTKFAEIMYEGIEARGGTMLELRGDEAVGTFASARQALRAAVDLQLTFFDETGIDPRFPMRVGIGIDAGEAVPVGDGYRGGALNLAARLCSQATAGEVLASQGVLHLARAVEGLRFVPRGELQLKGLPDPVRVHLVEDDDGQMASGPPVVDQVGRPRPEAPELPVALDAGTPLVPGREREVRWLRWWWRQARRGSGRALLVSGPEGIGKTRTIAEVAEIARGDGARVAYAACSGPTDAVREAIAVIGSADGAALVVLDDLDAAPGDELEAAVSAAQTVRGRKVLLVGAYRDDAAPPALAAFVRRLLDADGDSHRRLDALDADGVRSVAALYLGQAAAGLDVGHLLEDTGGVPGLVHRAVADLANAEANRRLGEAASRAAIGRGDLRAMEAELARNVIDLQRVRERARRYTAAPPGRPGDEGAARSPFKGLASFDVGDADLYFGRERLVAEMIARLAGAHLLGVVGPSGSGKSSAVRAGLVSALADGILPGSDRWVGVLLRPGEHPSRELDRALFAGLPEPVRAKLSGSDEPLGALVEVLAADERVLVVVDQFEETFTQCTDAEEREAFVRALTDAANDSAGRALVVVAVRADFYGRCAEHPRLAELLGANHVLVGPMTSDEYRRAIEEPARRAGLRVDPPLVDALVGEVAEEPGGLPLLSTALLELWERRDGRSLRMASYVETGGVRGAVGRLAEEAYTSLTPDQQAVCRSILLRLAGTGEGEAVVRRRVPLGEFDAKNADVARVLSVLTERRLVTVSEGTVEVSHEALLREWARLQEWLEEDRQGRRLRQHLIEAAKEWAEAGRDASELYRGARLASALDWTTEHTLELNELERDFLGESRATSERETERQRRTNRRLRGLLAGVAVFLVLALVAGSVALVQRGRSRRSALVALSRSLGSQGVIEPRLDRGLLLAREAVNLDVSDQTRSTLLATVLRDPAAVGVLYGGDSGRRPLGVALSPDGRTLAVQYNVQDLELFDTSSFTPRATVPFAAGGPPAFSPDGALIAAPSAGANGKLTGGVDLRDPATGRLLGVLPGDPELDAATGIAVPQVAFSRDGGQVYGLVREFRGGEVFIPAAVYVFGWDVASRTPLGPGTNLGDIATSGFGLTPDGRLVVSGDHTTIRDARTTDHERTLEAGGSVAMAVSPDGTTMALGDGDGSVRFVDLGTGEVTPGAGRHTARVESVGFASDSTAVTTGDDGHVILWDVASRASTESFSGHGGSVLAQATDGETLYTASTDGTIFAWDLSGNQRLGRSFPAGSGSQDPFWGPVPELSLSADGSTLAVTQADGYVNLWDLATLHRVRSFRAVSRGRLMSANFSPDGTTLAATGAGGQVVLWDLTRSPPTPRRVTGLPPADRYSALFWSSFSPDGRTLAAGDWRQVTPSSTEGELGGQLSEGYLATWDARSGDLLRGPVHLDAGVSQVVFSPDGALMAVTQADGHVSLVHARTLKIVRTLAADTAVPPTAWATFSPDGDTLATGGWSGVVRLWDVASGRPLRRFLAAAGYLYSVEFDPSGELLLTSGSDGTTRLWDAATGRQFGASFPGFENVVNVSAFTPDGSELVVVYSNGQAFIWPARWQAWAAHACEVAGRQLTREEWSAFVPDRPYEPVCPAESSR